MDDDSKITIKYEDIRYKWQQFLNDVKTEMKNKQGELQ